MKLIVIVNVLKIEDVAIFIQTMYRIAWILDIRIEVTEEIPELPVAFGYQHPGLMAFGLAGVIGAERFAECLACHFFLGLMVMAFSRSSTFRLETGTISFPISFFHAERSSMTRSMVSS